MVLNRPLVAKVADIVVERKASKWHAVGLELLQHCQKLPE